MKNKINKLAKYVHREIKGRRKVNKIWYKYIYAFKQQRIATTSARKWGFVSLLTASINDNDKKVQYLPQLKLEKSWQFKLNTDAKDQLLKTSNLRTCRCWKWSFGRNMSTNVIVLVSCERINSAKNNVEGLNSDKYQSLIM